MEIGEQQTLTVKEARPDGFLVGDDDGSAFLLRREAPDELAVGDDLEVFVYTDRSGAPMATLDTPKVQRGGFACLEVVDVADHGAYLNWGLERDLFVPGGLQHHPLRVGERAVVVVDVDDRGRVYASSRLADYFDSAVGELAYGEEVSLLVYGFNDLGALVVVNGRFTGMIYRNETYRPALLGSTPTGWVKAIRDDGRVDVSLQRLGRAGTLDARDVLLEKLRESGGFLALTDRSDPTRIRSQLRMSKKVFKKAVGSLYKDRLITLEDDGIRLV